VAALNYEAKLIRELKLRFNRAGVITKGVFLQKLPVSRLALDHSFAFHNQNSSACLDEFLQL